MLAKERQVLGFYLSDHPLRKYDVEYSSFATVHLGEPATYNFNDIVRACGVVTDVSPKTDKAGRRMAFFKLDDYSGSCDCLMFSKTYAEYGELITRESTIMIKGKLESSGDTVKLHVDEAVKLSEVKAKLTKRIGIVMDPTTHNENSISKLKILLENNEGNIPVLLCVKDNSHSREFTVDYKVNISDEFIDSVRGLFGDDSIIYFTT